MDYRPRLVDMQLRTALEAAGAVVIEGPRACGKTESARQASRSEIRIDTLESRQAMTVSPALLLEGANPRLLDEWQVEPELWNYVRHAVDDRQEKGQFILTGSAVPRDDPKRHPGAGRFIHLRMRTMTLAETGHSTGRVPFGAILRGADITSPEPGLTVPDIAERIVIGGWPGHLGLNARQAQRLMTGYIEDVSRHDVSRLDGIRRDPAGVSRVITSLARNVATAASLEAITADAAGVDGSIKVETVRAYLGALSRLMVTDDVAAWSPDLRSRTRLRAASIRHLADPALAAAALRATPARLLGDLNTMGLLFESMVVRDLRVYAETQDAQVFHYRDETGLEADLIVELPDGRWAGFEIKLGSSPEVVDRAARSLLRLAHRVAGQPPVALAVITGTGYGLTRPDGVLQIPIGALGA
jgi:predicted AAA+ superfamily ATPase